MDLHGIAKSGWVYRQTAILKHWKKVWLVLRPTGELQYFEDTNSSRAKDSLFMPETLEIRVGETVRYVTPPEKLSADFLFAAVPRHGSNWQFCADSLDDRTAWQLALQEARGVRTVLRRSLSQNNFYLPSVQGAPPAGNYAYMPGGYAGGQYRPPGYVYESGPGQVTQVYYVDGPGRYYYNGPDYTLGIVGGVAAGTVLGTAMVWPLMWCF